MTSLTDALSFTNPKCRVQSPRRTNEFDKIKSCYNGKRTTVDGQDPIVCYWKKRPDVTVLAYPPIIDAKPTDFSTVPTAMKKCLDMSMDAGQEHAIQTSDQQRYAIAQQVKWSRPVIFEPCILRLGGFHSLFTFIFALGK